MLDHLSHAFLHLSDFCVVGMKDQLVRPTAVEDVVRVLRDGVGGGTDDARKHWPQWAGRNDAARGGWPGG